jgi:glycosyltransferase involved in cell wall biosynthesis
MGLKIAIYTICLNEEAHCERWASSVFNADYRIVLDTGSTDNTVQKLKSLGVTVYQQKFVPWRFDTARNAALSLIPTDADVCISMDMDEFMANGYREKIEKIWSKETTRLAYTYVFDYNYNGLNQGFYSDKIHSRVGYEWRRPVHETIYPQDNFKEIIASDLNITMNQIQDRTKNTRNNYLSLLKLAYEENPNDSQIAFWYGRELLYSNDNTTAIQVLKHYLNLPNSHWDAERSEALIHLSKLENNKSWEHLMLAAATAPTRREVWLEIANNCYQRQDWINLLWACLNGLEKSKHQGSYLDKKESWGPQLADLGSIASFHLGWYSKAVDLVNDAITLSPNDTRLKKNLDFMVKANNKENKIEI